MAGVETPTVAHGSGAHPIVIDDNGLEILDRATCLTLLVRSLIGRVAYVGAGLPRIVPVNIAARDGELFLRVIADGVLAAIADGQLLTIEADDIDIDARCGWSVIVTGRAHETVGSSVQSQPIVHSWLRSETARTVRLTPITVSGRRLRVSTTGDATLTPRDSPRGS